MKKLLVAILAVTLLTAPAFAANDGGKKKAKKQEKTECKKDSCCDPGKCDPTKCDRECCDASNCKQGEEAGKEQKCTPAPSCTGSK